VPPFPIGKVPVISVTPPAKLSAEVESTPDALLCTIPVVERLERVTLLKVGLEVVLIF
jgi:hypothetical protein